MNELESNKSQISHKSRAQSFKRDHEIELSIKSEDETQHLLGDLPPTPGTWSSWDEKSVGQGYASTFSGSESEADPTDSEDFSEDNGPVGGAETPRPSRSQRSAVQPPQAIELNPFNHQVGGHTALYRISRHAVCKKLNNRENKFYETVEQFHPELLDFMPRSVNDFTSVKEKFLRASRELAVETSLVHLPNHRLIPNALGISAS